MALLLFLRFFVVSVKVFRLADICVCVCVCVDRTVLAVPVTFAVFYFYFFINQIRWAR